MEEKVIEEKTTELTKEEAERLKKIQKKGEFIRALKFLVFSISAGVIQIGSFTLLNEVIKVNYWVAYLPSLVLSVLFNFTINRKFTFKAANNVPVAMLKVLAYYVVFTPLSTWWGDALNAIGWNEYVVLVGTMVINFVTEFLFTRFVVYRNAVNTSKDGQKDKEKELEEAKKV